MSPELIDPEGIPVFIGDLEQLSTDALLLTAEASAFRFAGADVHGKFQGLSACYSAPEAEQLFATTAPVAAKADKFADDLEKVGAALSAYEAEIQPLVAKLKSLKARAESFRADIAGDDHWLEDNDNVQLNNDLFYDVNTTQVAFWQAERTCHNKITALVHGTTLIVEDGAQERLLKRGTSTYGFTQDLLDQSDDLPWGRTVEKERHGLDWLGHQIVEFGKGFFVDGLWGTIRGLGTMVGFDGLEAMGEAWTHLGKLATGIAITLSPLGTAYWLAPDDKLPSYLRESRQTVVDTGKALIAYDEWGKNPARAGGAVTFNALTTIFTGGAGSAAKSGAVARTLGALGKAGRWVDPMTYIGKAAKFGTVKVGDLFGSLKNLKAGAYTDVLSGAGKVQPDGSVLKIADDVPVVVGNHIEWPDGTRLNLDDGSVIKPDGTRAAAKVELSAADRAMLERSLPHGEAVLVGAGDGVAAHVGGEATAHVSGDATARTGGDATAHADGNAATHIGERAGARSTDTLSSHDTSVHATGGDHSPGADGIGGGHGDGGDASRTGGQDGPGSGEHDPLVREREIMRQQVERANTDPKWFAENYRDNGYRRSTKYTGGYDQTIPQLVRNPFGGPNKWIAASDMPPPIREHYVSNVPKLGKRLTVSDKIQHFLDQQAAKRDRAITHDKAAEARLEAAEKAYAADPTKELAEAMRHAEDAHRPLHSGMNRASEMFGEHVAEHRAIPEHFPDAVRVDDGAFGNNRFDQIYKTPDGRFVVVEAKGSERANLGVRKGHSGRLVKQGSREYFETILEEMEKRAKRNENKGLLDKAEAERKLADDLDRALTDKKVDYVVVKAKSDGAQYAGYDMYQFDLTK
ncbi:hypothetical protein [Streptomyces olivochromogenes]|uniref:hypothetical protein n=1 Tax=Streptomyces olivochromogenes TaxID=1963 RepID=UPI001F3C4591|nr:hypothetical protein [Streptomyces olivochromogenes]MCF3135037.1 hypothetical protein [Streptomyces olivochromogenes]